MGPLTLGDATRNSQKAYLGLLRKLHLRDIARVPQEEEAEAEVVKAPAVEVETLLRGVVKDLLEAEEEMLKKSKCIWNSFFTLLCFECQTANQVRYLISWAPKTFPYPST